MTTNPSRELFPYRHGEAATAEHPAELFHGRIEINWDYLVERRPLVRQIHPELPA